jgi:hypothetical protein
VNRPQDVVIVVVAILLSCAGCAPTEDPEPSPQVLMEALGQCEDVKSVFERIECFVALATDKDDPSVCGHSSHEGVKYQCYAILAERRGSRELCNMIPPRSRDYVELSDICISDVAKKTLSPLLCEGIQTAGLRDSCYAKIGQESKDKTLCQKIEDPGLRSICSGEPVVVK